MATFAIGDIHGCFRTLQRLMKTIRFDPARDRLWLVGDLVNRGPMSLEVLRWVRQLGDRAVCVLGNHDLKLLACGLGIRSSLKNPHLSSILAAGDCEEMLAWLRSRPLVHCEGEYVLVHAGLLPGWTVDQAIQLGREIQRRLMGSGGRGTVAVPVGGKPGRVHGEGPRGITIGAGPQSHDPTEDAQPGRKHGSELRGSPGGDAGHPHPMVCISRPAQRLGHHCFRALGRPGVVPGTRSRRPRQQLFPRRTVDGNAIGEERTLRGSQRALTTATAGFFSRNLWVNSA